LSSISISTVTSSFSSSILFAIQILHFVLGNTVLILRLLADAKVAIILLTIPTRMEGMCHSSSASSTGTTAFVCDVPLVTMINFVIVISSLSKSGFNDFESRGIGRYPIEQRVVAKLGVLKHGVEHLAKFAYRRN